MKRSVITISRSILAAALLSVGCTMAAQSVKTPYTPPGNDTPMPGNGSTTMKSSVSQDHQFAVKAAEAGMAEVAEGKLAEQKAQNEQVQRFADRMIKDHSTANDQLKQIASGKGINLPEKLERSAGSEMDKLQKLSGDKFDQAYMKHNVSAHKKVIKEFEKEAKSGKDDDLKRFASEKLPMLQEHLKLAESAQDAATSKRANTSAER